MSASVKHFIANLCCIYILTFQFIKQFTLISYIFNLSNGNNALESRDKHLCGGVCKKAQLPVNLYK